MLATSILYRSYDICIFGVRSFVFSTRLLSLIIILIYISQLLDISDWWFGFVEHQVAFISQREYGGITFPYIYFIASPLLIILVAYELDRVIIGRGLLRHFWFGLASTALFFIEIRF